MPGATRRPGLTSYSPQVRELNIRGSNPAHATKFNIVGTWSWWHFTLCLPALDSYLVTNNYHRT